MKRILILILALTSARPLSAQATDVISGKWGQDGTTLLDLKFDGAGRVSGTIYLVGGGTAAPAPIRLGSFDPGSGELKLAGEVKHPQNGQLIPYAIDGTLADGRLSLRYRFSDDNTGATTLTRLGGPANSSQPPAAAADLGASLQKHLTDVMAHVTRSAELVPAERYGYQPSASVRTFAQLIGHIADGYRYSCGTASGKKIEWSDAVEKAGQDKASVIAKLKEATSACTAVAGSGRGDALVEAIAHTNLHYGNVITYLRMMGLVPPSS